MIKNISKNRQFIEITRYGLFGLATTVVNISIFQILMFFFDYRISNLIAIITSKLFAYIMNKLFVFHSSCADIKGLILEIGRFILARGTSGIIDYCELLIAVEMLRLNPVYSKYALQLIVILLNYLFSKRFVFNVSDK